MARTKAISLIQSGSTKADLAELSGLVIANIQKDTLAQGLKSQAYSFFTHLLTSYSFDYFGNILTVNVVNSRIWDHFYCLFADK